MNVATLTSKNHYPYVTKSIIRLANTGALSNVTAIDIEPEYGYVTRLTYNNGSHRITYGNDLGLNSAAACDLAQDKGHTKYMLRTLGIHCPNGKEFLLPWWYETIRQSQITKKHTTIRTTDQAADYIDSTFEYPVYVKPVDGSKGNNIFKIQTPHELEEVFSLYNEKRIRVAVVEEPLYMPDYRIVCLDGVLISAYERIPLTITGDGSSSIHLLIKQLRQQYEQRGRDTRLDSKDERILHHLRQQGMTIHDIPMLNQEIPLMPVSNLSTGGTSRDVTGSIHPRWVALAASISNNFNLRLIGLDIACSDITSPSADYSIIEVNATPGLDHYVQSGDSQKELIDQLYTKILNAYPTAEKI
jgi:D-alanine-D-alanine ligase-like ATP-grasp enzyme